MKVIIVLLTFMIVGCNGFKTSTSLSLEQDFQDIEGSLTPERGGSNYAFIELGRYATNPTEENWAADVKTPLTHYHEYQQKVRSQLDALIQTGQRKIALIVWFGGPHQTCQTYAHTLCPQNGKMPAIGKQNLENLLLDITARPFKEVQIRFGGQGTADAYGWTTDPQENIESNIGFVFDAIDISEAILKTKTIQYYFDLGMELMGQSKLPSKPLVRNYLAKVWNHYIDRYDVSKTIGFSFNHAHKDSTLASLKIFDDSGVRPPRLAFDIYVDRKKFYNNILLALNQRGWGSRYPIFIQETYRNDPLVVQDLTDAVDRLGLNIRTIMQWPLEQGSLGHATSAEYPFYFYL